MTSDKASAEVAKGFRAVGDIISQIVQLSYKRDIEVKAFKKRELDYNNKIAGARQFPAVNELYAKLSKHHREIMEPIEKKLAELATEYQNVTEKFAEVLVKALPVNEIKIRQVLDAAKGELSRDDKPSQPEQGDRFRKLEELVNSMKGRQEAQDLELARLKKLNDKLRAADNGPEALEKEKEQLRTENCSLRNQLDALAKKVDSIEAWKKVFPSEVNSHRADYSKSLELAKAEWSTTTAQLAASVKQDDTAREQIATLVQKDKALSAEVAALRKDVDGHEDLLANVDIENLDDTIAKVLEYPRFYALNDRVTSHEADIQSLKESLNSTKQDLETDLARRFRGFSDKIIDYCGPKFDGFENRIKSLEEADSNTGFTSSTGAPAPQAGTLNPGSAPTSGPNLSLSLESLSSRLDMAESCLAAEESRANATKSNVEALRTKTDGLQTDINAIRGQIEQRYGALETMVESLDEQWKNVNTAPMAQHILEHLSRLQPSQLTPELRQFHIRLANVEKTIQDEKQDRQGLRARIHSACEDIVFEQGAKRAFTGDERFAGPKRARVDGVNEGTNGHAQQ